MWFCYVDEAGDMGAIADPPRKNDQPVFVLGGLFVAAECIDSLTLDYMDLMGRFFPGKMAQGGRLDRILQEVKGCDIRKHACGANRNRRRHAVGFLDGVFSLLERVGACFVARCWIKSPGHPFDGRSVYTSSLQAICHEFDEFLQQRGVCGVVIVDSRFKKENTNAAHSIFTQRHAQDGPHYRALAEIPTFGHSDNHAGLQLCDMLVSAVIFPIACAAYCSQMTSSCHVRPQALHLRDRFGKRLKKMGFRYFDSSSDRMRGGITLSDPVGRRAARYLFAC